LKLREIDRKLVLLGDGKVGKTSLITRFLEKSFSPGYVPGTGLRVFSKTLEFAYPNLIVNMRMGIWDTAGQKWYTRIREPAFEGAHGIIIISDLSRPETIASLEDFWIGEIKKSTKHPPIAIVGNKLDLITKNSRIIDLLEEIGARNGVEVFLTSAKMGENVDNVFRLVGEKFIKEMAISTKAEKKGAPTTLEEALDHIIEDFISQQGNVEKSLMIIQNQFKEAGVDMESPGKKEVLRALELIRKVETILLTENVAKVNYNIRKNLVESVRESN